MYIALRSGPDIDVVVTPADVIGAFLERTLEAVPLGEETSYLGFQEGVSRLLGEA
ncbi:hypothetical protein ACGFZA_42340 [Streptomyces sp. NPDC048211]|uniref:hypothetical protein n=1 Tax=Streptomyces sp. NPDC048211 TaxID=3365516 RepID=UPI000B2F9E79